MIEVPTAYNGKLLGEQRAVNEQMSEPEGVLYLDVTDKEQNVAAVPSMGNTAATSKCTDDPDDVPNTAATAQCYWSVAVSILLVAGSVLLIGGTVGGWFDAGTCTQVSNRVTAPCS